MPSWVMQVVEFANGSHCAIAGQYLQWFDFEAYGGHGFGQFTADINRAKKFADPGTLLEFWRTQSRVQPTRDDGKPNRPLTATTIMLVKLEESVS